MTGMAPKGFLEPTLFPQVREEGKSVLQEVLKLKAMQDSTSGGQAMEDLSALDLNQEFSPIT